MKRLIATAALVLGLGGNMALPAQAGEFSETQKKEIWQVVKDYLLKNPGILMEMSQALERERQEKERKREEEVAKYLAAHAKEVFTPRPFDPTIGPEDARVTLIEFYDYNCKYCKRGLKTLQRLVKEHPDVRIIFKEFPILADFTLGGSMEASLVSMAIYRLYPEKFWDFHQRALEYVGLVNRRVALKIAEKMGLDVKRIEKEMANPDMQKALVANDALARKLAIAGTPAFVAPGIVLRGLPRYEVLEKIVAEQRKAAEKG